jgi:hypothetical protein
MDFSGAPKVVLHGARIHAQGRLDVRHHPSKDDFLIAQIENSDRGRHGLRVYLGHVRYLSEAEFVDYVAHYHIGHTNYVLLGWVPVS